MYAELLFQVVCLAVLLPGGPARVYTGRKKLANFAVERRRIGPHVCLSGFGSGCCPGWTPSPGSGQCILPLCSFGCGSGFCIAPNVCSCRDGGQGITCQEPPSACGEYGCDIACNHGGCQEVARVCPLGFSMTETANGVRCADIDECLSASCEGLCVNTEGGFVCECGPGMQLSADRHTCQDTDECLATPCQHHCKNSIGSYRCSCHPGFYLHGNRHSCVDVNECRRPGEKRACQHACHNTLGSFMCSCRPGYHLGVDRVSCEGFSKTGLAPSPILQSLQHPPTLLRLSPEAVAPVLPPRGPPPSRAPVPHSMPRTPAPSPPFPTLSAFPHAASHTPSPSSPFGSPSLLRTARPPVPTSPQLPSLLQEATTMPPLSSPTVPLTSSSALPSACWHGGALRESGSHWIDPVCLNCSCESGQVLCQAVKCEVACSHPVPPGEGECCPICAGCFYYGISRAEGEVFSLSKENCTVCVCLAGNVSCISPECTPSQCSAQTDCCPCQPEPVECHFRGQIYAEGTEFSLDGDDCTTCVCRQGEAECSFTPCPTLECPQDDWVLAPGQCCFTCRKAAPTTGCLVDDNGVEFPVGQIWSPGDPCELCICQADGSVSCKRTDCLETCPHPIQIPGQCCPDCSAGCTYAGKTHYNNETFPSVLDPCLSCICLLGSVACSPVHCIVFCTYPFHPEGECCPVCHDCNYKGRKVVNGHNFAPEGDPCLNCTCQLGEVSCEKRLCPSNCAEPSAPPAHCCPNCQDNEITDDLTSLENSITSSQFEDGESKTGLQAFRSMALMSNRNCSYCSTNLTVATPSPEADPAAHNNISALKTPPVSQTASEHIEARQTRPGEHDSLRLNRPPSVKPPPPWLGRSVTPQMKPGSAPLLLNRPESMGSPAIRASDSSSTHSSVPSLVTRTTGDTVAPTDVHPSAPLIVGKLRNSLASLFQLSETHHLPLLPPEETLSPSASPNLASLSLQEYLGSPSDRTGSPSVGPQMVENSSTLPPGGGNNLNGSDP
uniref:von Willebrand factor C and EGF domain-containing protein isoform X1 n=3 Tax=Pogona vitticeps TaxID=103695 RepID=A0ABM5F872_9SAUR